MFPLNDTAPRRSFPFATWLLIALNLLVFFHELALGPRQLDRLVMTYGMSPARVIHGEGWGFLTLVTSMFLHGGWVHIISNMWALFIFGDNVEDRMGAGRYLFFYLLSGVSAGLLQAFADPNARLPAIGASGAIAGVLGAYLLLFPGARVLTLVPLFILPWLIEIPALIYLGFWFVTQFFSGVLSIGVAAGGIAYWAHVGGFLFGAVAVPFFVRRSGVRYAESLSASRSLSRRAR